MFRFLQYLRFLANSTNQHGVHSPFIFAYLTQCLYTRPRMHGRKTLDVLLKSIRYFNPDRIQLPEKGPEHELIAKYFPNVDIVKGPAGIIYLNSPEKDTLDALLDPNNSIGNDDMLLIDKIYADRKKKALWKELKENTRVSVTVDMFYCGAVFFRKEQAKEHFKIRI